MPRRVQRPADSGAKAGRDRRQALIDAHNLLRKVIVLESDDLYGHPWIFEGDRWKELVFALLVRIVPHREESDIRTLVERMHGLRLLDVTDLASICTGSNKPRLRHQRARLIIELLVESAFTKEDAERGLLTICEAAIGLRKHFDGKIQRYLRRYGELIIKESKDVFCFTALDEAEVRHSLTYWLQNVLLMPLPLVDKSWEVVCSRYGVAPAHLISAADDLGINLALLDDFLRSYVAKRQIEDARDTGSGRKTTEPASKSVRLSGK